LAAGRSDTPGKSTPQNRRLDGSRDKLHTGLAFPPNPA